MREARTYLQSLHRFVAIVTIDEAANNYILICKRFYINDLFAEIGTFISSNTKTYSKVDTSKEDIKNTNLKYCPNFGMTVRDKQKYLPVIYLLPKMHKTPIGCRSIVMSKQDSI